MIRIKVISLSASDSIMDDRVKTRYVIGPPTLGLFYVFDIR